MIPHETMPRPASLSRKHVILPVFDLNARVDVTRAAAGVCGREDGTCWGYAGAGESPISMGLTLDGITLGMLASALGAKVDLGGVHLVGEVD